MMGEAKIVCKICYASSSHKPVPTLTPESKTFLEGSLKKCSVCRQGWAPIRVAKEASRWVRIRARPKINPNTEFQMCKNVPQGGGKGDCPRGLDCSYAHSRVELSVWIAERRQEPRPAPTVSGQYQLCKHVHAGASCPYGQRCTFAHSEEEYQEWLRAGPRPQPTPAPPPSGSWQGASLRCELCGLTCTSRRQLDDHLAGAKHRERVLQMGEDPLPPPHHPLPPSTSTPSTSSSSTVRKKPLLSFHIVGFKMCMHVTAGRRCVYGEYCTFAHSSEELQAWNRELGSSYHYRQPLPRSSGGQPSHPYTLTNSTEVKGRVVRTAVEQQKPDVFAESAGLDDFDETHSVAQPVVEGVGGEGEELVGAEEGRGEGETEPPPGDFADEVRRRISTEFSGQQEMVGFQPSVEGVTVEEVSGQDLCLTWTQPDSLHWTFEVSCSVAAGRVLKSVVLFDALAMDFTILGVWLLQGGARHQQALSCPSALQGAGLLLQQRLVPPDKVHVKVSLKPRSGVLGQLVIFDFGTFCLARGLSIHVLNESERRLMMNIKQPSPLRPAKPDLYWEQHYTSISMPGRGQDEVFDSGLAEYPLPEQIERFIDAGKYNNVENKVTPENYKRRLHNLLYLEEYQQRVDMSRERSPCSYDIYDIEICPESSVQTPHGTVYATEGQHYITVSVEEVLFEGGRSIRPGDSCLLLPMNQQVVHECWVESVGRDRVTLRISEKAKQASVSSRNRCSLRFVLSRTHMREMHYAVDQLSLSVVFPSPRPASKSQTPPACLQELKNTKLNLTQKNAIGSMLDPACQQIPSLVLGPFGCGKTRTLRECILLLSLLPDPTILICTHSNSAANIYIQDLSREYTKRGVKVSMIRIYYTGRRLETIPIEIRPFCKLENGRPALPTLSELKQYRVVVATLSTSRILSLMGLPRGHFSHIFVDEAAQALESETLIPLVLAGERTKVVLAGDHMQMDPPCYSPIARRYGLHVSLLERLYDHEAYSSGMGQLCKTLLTENHRSHPNIMEIPSRLFYKNKLTCRAKFPDTGPRHIPALKFIGVDGQEAQDDDSPSYYNNHEALKITEQVKQLVSGGLGEEEICVLAYYQKQVTRIRHLLRNDHLGKVAVFRVEDVQGKEYRALLLSTVRTCYARDDKEMEEDAGFLTNPKLFNTAVTRAREWLVVCGEPVTLCTVGSNRLCWIELIKKCLHQLDSFEYPNASQFERLLQTKLFTRKILEKRNKQFFQQIKTFQSQPPVSPAAAGQGPSPASVSPSVPSSSTPAPAPTPSPGQGFASAPAHVRHQMLRQQVTELAQGSDDITVNKITDELMKLSVQEQASLVARRDILHMRVREIESVLRRPGPTAAILSTTTVPTPVLGQGTHHTMAPSLYPMAVVAHKYAPDLPPFLTSIIDGLTNYMKWCDMHLQNPQNNRPGLKENLSRQRENLGRQSELVNQQITMYRTNLPPTQSKRLSPLEAAINDVSSRSSPQPLPSETNTDVYVSDDEFNS